MVDLVIGLISLLPFENEFSLGLVDGRLSNPQVVFSTVYLWCRNDGEEHGACRRVTNPSYINKSFTNVGHWMH